ncbi:MAG: MFS transporter [Halioglobus sp.]|nr:MFS transporter [Halioglobus sp.]
MTSEEEIKDKNFLKYLLVVLFIIPLSGMGTDIYVPSLPAISNAFHISTTLAQTSVAIYIFGYGVGQLIVGPISDHYGRKPVVIIGLVLYISLILVFLLFPTVRSLMVLRFCQGLILAAAIVPCRSILSDVATGELYKKLVNYMTISWSFGVVFSPVIGGYLQHYFGWEYNFYFLLAYSSIGLLAFSLFYKETHFPQGAFSINVAVRNYVSLLTDVQFVSSIFLLGLLSSLIILFNIVAPFLVQVQLKLSSIDYGNLAFFIGIAWLFGNIVSRFFIAKPVRVKIKYAIMGLLLSAVFMVFISQRMPLSLLTLGLGTWSIVFFGGFIFPIFVGYNLARYRNVASTSNALLFAGIWVVCSATTSLASNLDDINQIPLSFALLASTIAVAVVYWILLRKKVA